MYSSGLRAQMNWKVLLVDDRNSEMCLIQKPNARIFYQTSVERRRAHSEVEDIDERCSDEKNPRAKPYTISNQKLKDLGLEFTPVSQCLYETVKSLQEKGHLPVSTRVKS